MLDSKTLTEAAERAGVSVRTIHNYRQDPAFAARYRETVDRMHQDLSKIRCAERAAVHQARMKALDTLAAECERQVKKHTPSGSWEANQANRIRAAAEILKLTAEIQR